MSDKRTGRPGDKRPALDMPPEEFRALGHDLVDQIADFYASLSSRKISSGLDLNAVQAVLGSADLPEEGTDPAALLAETAPLLFDHSLHNGHPRFMGYITSSAAPLGVIADALAAAVNPNLARWEIAPVASEIESRAVAWVAELIGYTPFANGLMASGGNVANLLAFIAARRSILPWDVRKDGQYADPRRPTVYVSAQTHTWVDKAADVCGLGAEGIRWIDSDGEGRMRMDRLRTQITADRRDGRLPFLVVGTAGSTGLGVVDPLREIAVLAREEGLWFHVDGAYGAPAAVLPEAPADLHELSLADSVAIDPHKWLYCPIEAACVVTRHPDALREAFHFEPNYYRMSGRKASGTNYYELGLQNTRGFRALKVWLMMRAVGRSGYRDMIREDIQLAERLYERVDAHPEFAAHSVNLSITTFRFVPEDLATRESPEVADYLNKLNESLLAETQAGGELFLTNAVADGHYLLRACIVNFRTTNTDIDTIPGLVAEAGRNLDASLRPEHLAT